MRTTKMTTSDIEHYEWKTPVDNDDSDAGCAGQGILRRTLMQAAVMKNKRDGVSTSTTAYLAASSIPDE